MRRTALPSRAAAISARKYKFRKRMLTVMAVLVIAVTPDDEVLFVEQFRVPLGARTIEMPAGLVGDDHAHDTLADAARRELVEETGGTTSETLGRPAKLFRFRHAVLEERALAGTKLPLARS